MKDLKAKTVLITGGASGIGKIVARLLLERMAQVVIWDIDQASIDATIAELSGQGTVLGFKVDVSNAEQVQDTAQRVQREIGVVDVLINSAGIVVGKFFHEHNATDIASTLNINVAGSMYVANAFLEGMLAQDSGHICNIASSGGLISNPRMSVYAASKWAVIGWSDSLRLEMKQLKRNVQVTTIMPYYIHTGMFAGVRSKLPILEPEVAALAIVKAIEKDRTMVSIPGYIHRVTRFFQATLPIPVFDWFAGSVLGIYKTMEHFTGRRK